MKRLATLLVTIGLLFGYSPLATVRAADEPVLPQSFVNTIYPTQTGTTTTVGSGGNLQSALNSASPGDTIVLTEGVTFTGSFSLPTNLGSGWIVIRTSDMTNLPAEGTRVGPADASNMPKIVSANTEPAVKVSGRGTKYRLVGLEIKATSTNFGVVALGTAEETAESSIPLGIVIDRCYIHGNSTSDVSRGIALNSAETAIIDSYISDCHGEGFDAQAIASWNSPGPIKILNNYLEGAGENVIFGGADPSVEDLVVSDIEFRNNYCYKPLSWNPNDSSFTTPHWTVKNIFELKNAQRVLVTGNTFEHNWVDAQAGIAILFTPRNQNGTAPWCIVQDVTFINNIVRKTTGGVAILGTDNEQESGLLERVKIENNLFDEIGGTLWGGSDALFTILNGPCDSIIINHNTALNSWNIITVEGPENPGLIYTNNIALHNDYGIIGANHGIGNDSIDFFFPDSTITKNVIQGGYEPDYPDDNFFPSTISAIGFVDAANHNYRLSSLSPYAGAASDYKDIGVDFDVLDPAIAGDVTVTGVAGRFLSTPGGESTIITGSNFSAGATVDFGGAAATNVVVVSPFMITATYPAHAAGTVDVTVTNLDTSTGTMTDAVSYR
jgi:IPT/TIG domain